MPALIDFLIDVFAVIGALYTLDKFAGLFNELYGGEIIADDSLPDDYSYA